MNRGFLISFEGGEGCGKSTQARRLATRLKRIGYKVLLTREPGGTKLGEQIRSLLKSARHNNLSAEAELFLFAASRAQLVCEVIRPALQRGWIVLCDRFVDSTTAYQGYGRKLDLKLVQVVNALAVGPNWPDLTLLLDLDVRIGLQRALKRGQVSAYDRMGAQKEAFYRQVRSGFLKLARAEPKRIILVDAAGSADETTEKIWNPVLQRLHRKG